MSDEREDTRVEPTPEARIQQLEGSIADAREAVSSTAAELGERLAPGHLVSEAGARISRATKEGVRTMTDAAGEAALGVAESARDVADVATREAREHPAALALLGLGLGWLTYSMVSSPTSRASDGRYDRGASGDSVLSGGLPLALVGAGAAWWFWRHSQEENGFDRRQHYGAPSGASVGEHAASTTRAAGEKARSMSRRVRSGLGHMVHTNPLATGVAALAVGAAVGFAAPESRFEDEHLGPARDALLEKGRDATAEAVSTVKESVARAFSPETPETPETPGNPS